MSPPSLSPRGSVERRPSRGLAFAHLLLLLPLLLLLAQRGSHPVLPAPWAPASIGSLRDLNSGSPTRSRDPWLEGEAGGEWVAKHLVAQPPGEQEIR